MREEKCIFMYLKRSLSTSLSIFLVPGIIWSLLSSWLWQLILCLNWNFSRIIQRAGWPLFLSRCYDGISQWGRRWVCQAGWGSSSFTNVCRQYIEAVNRLLKFCPHRTRRPRVNSLSLFGLSSPCLLCSSWFLRFLTWTGMYHRWFSSFCNEDDISWDFSVSSITWAIPETCQLLQSIYPLLVQSWLF